MHQVHTATYSQMIRKKYVYVFKDYIYIYLHIYTRMQIYNKASVVNMDTGTQVYMRVLCMILETFLYVSRNCFKIENCPHNASLPWREAPGKEGRVRPGPEDKWQATTQQKLCLRAPWRLWGAGEVVEKNLQNVEMRQKGCVPFKCPCRALCRDSDPLADVLVSTH